MNRCMKIKGIKSGKIEQVTFIGEHNEIGGSVFTLDWAELRDWAEVHLNAKKIPSGEKDQVLAFKITERGLDVYHQRIQNMKEHFEFRARLLNQRKKEKV